MSAPAAPPLAAPPGAGGAPVSDAAYLDGVTARRRRAAARPSAAGLEIALLDAAPGEAAPAPWAWDRIVLLESPPGLLRLGHARGPTPEAGETGERIDLPEGPLAAVVRRACGGRAHFRRPGRGDARLVLWLVAAAASLVFAVVVLLPLVADRAVALVPWRTEAAFGAAVEEQVVAAVFGRAPRECRGTEGAAAFDALLDKLSRGAGLPGPVRASVVDHPLVNAFALPGGRVIVARGLIDRTTEPDELAGVLAHELGHVAARDSMRAVLNAGGLSLVLGLVLGDFTGSTVLIFASRTLLELRYSREREAAADRFAADALERNGADPAALARFFERVSPFRRAGADASREASSEAAILQNHPATAERVRELEARARPRPPGASPLLDARAWAALRAICRA